MSNLILLHFVKITHNNEWLQYKFVQMHSVLLYLNVHIIILHLCKVFLSLWLCFVWILVVLEIIKVNFHSSTPYHLVDLQQWPIYSLMLSLSSYLALKFHYFIKNTQFLLVNMFVYIYIISLYIHVLLCVNEPIDEDHVIICQLVFFCIIDHFISSP